jgi:tape measure domain-containing protein
VAVAVVDVQVNGQNAVRNLQQINAASKAATAGVDGLKAAATRLIGVFAGVSALKFVFAKTSELETQTRSLETLTGSAEKARQIISELQRIGAITPFTSTELIDAAKRLQAFGVEADKVVETTRRLADVSGATGAELQGLVTAYGQVQAKGRLQGEELLQFQERGVALQEELKKMYGLTGEEFQKALGKGRISAEAVEVALNRLTEVGGKYANGAVAQSTTLSGKLSTLVDGVENIARKIGEVLKPALDEILNLAIAVVNKINQALAGPDYKKANDQLYNTRAAIKQLTADIKVAEKAGIGMARGLEIKGVDGQVIAPSAPVLPRMKADLKDLQDQAKYLEGRLKSLRTATTADKPKPRLEPPPLLAEAEKDKTKAKSVSDLLGGQVQRTLELNKAQLEVVTAARMNTAALQDNAEQAKRMVEFASKYQGIQLEINALEDTITKRTAIRSQLLAEAKDKQSVALAFDEQTKDLQNAIAAKRLEINALTAEHIGQVNQLAITEAQKLESITEEGQHLQNIILYGEEEAAIRQKINSILKDTSTLDAKAVEDAVRRNSALTQQIDAAGQLKQVYQDIGMSIKSGVVDAITSAIDGTKTLGEVANNVMRNIANKLIDVAINMALFGVPMGGGKGGGLLGGLFRANGGSVMAGQSYVVGERGPELFTPGRSGSIAPNSAMGGSNIVVNVDATGTSVQGNSDDSKRLGEAIGVAIRQELIKQKRPGGLLS